MVVLSLETLETQVSRADQFSLKLLLVVLINIDFSSRERLDETARSSANLNFPSNMSTGPRVSFIENRITQSLQSHRERGR